MCTYYIFGITDGFNVADASVCVCVCSRVFVCMRTIQYISANSRGSIELWCQNNMLHVDEMSIRHHTCGHHPATLSGDIERAV